MIRVRQIKIDVLSDTSEVLLNAVAERLGVKKNDIDEINIRKKSVDARNKNEIYFVYEADISVKGEKSVLKRKGGANLFLSPDDGYRFPEKGSLPLNNRPVIVGSGPAGLFASYMLAENGYRPIVIERGADIDSRKKAVEEFWSTGKLDKNTNVQFGEGGAGTFSDGKLNTLVKDRHGRCKRVLEIFVECGAPKEILYEQKPHIGTDLLFGVIKNMRKKIEKMGGTFMFNACLTDIICENGNIKSITVNGEKNIDCDVLVLAIGHSARDTFRLLSERNIKMNAKPFAVGVRVQHGQDMINLSQYGKYKDVLPPASYKLTYRAKNGRGVYTFCMCPGGYVVNASSESGRLAVNGMSFHKRDGENANSAVIVTVSPDDFGSNPLDGLEFQRRLEEAAYTAGGGKIPVQLLDDFIGGKISENFGGVKPSFMGGTHFADINGILPKEIADAIKEAFSDFGKKIKGFDGGDAILAAVESRTSSPVKIERNENGEGSLGCLYPCGEGAGYAGGITSAAADGIKTAEKIAEKYMP